MSLCPDLIFITSRVCRHAPCGYVTTPMFSQTNGFKVSHRTREHPETTCSHCCVWRHSRFWWTVKGRDVWLVCCLACDAMIFVVSVKLRRLRSRWHTSLSMKWWIQTSVTAAAAPAVCHSLQPNSVHKSGTLTQPHSPANVHTSHGPCKAEETLLSLDPNRSFTSTRGKF